jgi:hypothetical protein
MPEIDFVTERNGQLIVREDNVFVPESTLMVKITTPITYNQYRLVAMDYVMVITDPYDNIVFIKLIKDRSRSYTTISEVVFSKQIPTTWLNGDYTIDIYSYDRVDYSELGRVDFNIYDKDVAIDDMEDFFDTPSDSLLEDMEVLKSRSYANIVEDRLYFYVDKYSNPCKIQEISVMPSIVPINSTVRISVEVENTIPHQNNVTYQLFLNNESIKTFNFIFGPNEWKTLVYELNDPPLGENQINMGGKTINFTVSGTALGPTQFVYLDIFTDRPVTYAGESFNLSITILNTGWKGNEPVFISVNNKQMSREVELDYGEKTTINYEILINEPGTYPANIVGTEITKILFIKDSPVSINEEEEEDKSVISGLYSGMISSKAIFLVPILFVILGFLLYYRQRTPVKKPELSEAAKSIEDTNI